MLDDLDALEDNGMQFKDRLFISNRAHIVTAMHKKVARRLRDIRNDTIWVNGSDIAMSFKPMKMGLRMVHLMQT